MINSKYLNKGIDLTTGFATVSGGKKKTIVFHNELDDFINNEMMGMVQYRYTTVIPGYEDAVVVCEMWDDKGRKVSAVGETTKETLNSLVAKSYPTTTAANKAFDRAAIRFLALGKGVYSDQELAPDGPRNFETSNLIDGSGEPPIDVSEETAQEKHETSEVANSIDEPQKEDDKKSEEKTEATSTNEVESAKEQKENSSSNANTQAKVDDGGEVLINMGSYKQNPQTVEQIYKSNPDWLGVAFKIKPSKAEIVNQVNAIKRYLAAHPLREERKNGMAK